MRSKLCLVAILSLASPALSAAASAGQGEEQLTRSFFRAGVLEGCMSKAPKAAAAGMDISPTCTCAAETLSANISNAELAQLETSRPESLDAKIQAAIAACLAVSPPVRAR